MNFEYMSERGFNISYGLGIIPMVYPVANGSMNPNHVYPNYPSNEIIGHLGEDWGSGAQLVGYNFPLKFSMVSAMNTAGGQNCSLKGDAYWANWRFSH